MGTIERKLSKYPIVLIYLIIRLSYQLSNNFVFKNAQPIIISDYWTIETIELVGARLVQLPKENYRVYYSVVFTLKKKYQLIHYI